MKYNKEKYSNKQKWVLEGFLLSLLVGFPAIIGFGIILMSRGTLNPNTLSLGCFLAGFSGVIVVIRKEAPTSIIRIRGIWAIIEGILFTLLCWGASIFFFFNGLR
jgi:hypothetical protein